MSNDEPTTTTARRPRQTRDELRAQVLAAGVELLGDEGVEFRLDNLTFPRVFDRILAATGRRIVPAMVYERIWRNQEEFQWQVLEELIRSTKRSESVTVRAIESAVEAADLGDAASRERALVEVCRIAGRVDVDKVQRDRQWWITVAAVAASSSRANLRDDAHVRPAVEESLTAEMHTYALVYQWVIDRLGFTMRAPFTTRDFALVVGALAEGIGLRVRYLPELFDDRTYDLGSGVAPWSHFAVGVLALKGLLVEIDVAFAAPSDPPGLHEFLAASMSAAHGTAGDEP